MIQSVFFDMDGTLFDSMPHHAQAWEEVMKRYQFDFTAKDVYLQEGRTGPDVITECYKRKYGVAPDKDWVWSLYKEKTEAFAHRGETYPIEGVAEVLQELQRQGISAWVVTGSAQDTLFAHLDHCFPGSFVRERMITAYDVEHGKPDPEPYLKAWERSGLKKEECIVVENAPLGVVSAKAAGLFTVAVNTGILERKDFQSVGADLILDNMEQLLVFFQVMAHIVKNVFPYYKTFDKGHNMEHVRKVIDESLVLARQYDADGIMAYTIAAYHDLGLRVNRAEHHLYSGAYIREDDALRQWFTPEQIEIMAQAAEDHRASAKSEPRSVYGKIVAEADRDISPETILRRTIQYGLKNYPELSAEQHFERAYEHMLDKYAEGGYIRLWLHSERNEKGLRELRDIIADRERLRSICLQLYAEETANC